MARFAPDAFEVRSARPRAGGYDALIRYIRQSGASVDALGAERERSLRGVAARYRKFLAELLNWPQFRQSVLIEMQLLGLRTARQGVSEEEAIHSLLVEQQKEIALGVLGSFSGNITTRQARHVLFQIGAEDDIPAARRRWLLPRELVALFDTLALHIKRDYRRYKAAQTDLFFSHVRLVYDLAQKSTLRPEQFADAFQDGCVALLHAIDKTASSGCRLSTCAHEWVRGAVSRSRQAERFPMRLPVRSHEALLPQRVTLDEHLPASPFIHPAELLARQEIRPLLCRLMNCLTDKQREVLVLRYGLGPDGVACSLQEAARIIGISFQEVDKREKRALERVAACGSPALLRELSLCLA